MSEPLRYTAARSSRINRDNPLKRRASDSPFAALKRQKPAPLRRKSTTATKDGEQNPTERLDDNGLIPPVNPKVSLSGVLAIVEHVRASMFTAMPDRATGMSSTRVAEVLNFRASLPPMVSTAHVHALSRSPTATERETASLCAQGVLRRVHVPLRGKGAAAAGEGVVLVADWTRLVQAHPDVSEAAKQRYLALMEANPTALGVPASSFAQEDVIALTHAGFLTTASAAPTTVDRFISASAANSGNRALLPSQIAQAASGSLAAIGGQDAFLGSGGGSMSGSGARAPKNVAGTVNFSLPNTGPYLELLVSARARLLDLLARSSPRFKEMPQVSLEDSWSGGVPTGTVADEARKERGDRRGLLLPGRTKKWRQFYGLELQWVLEECVGAGMAEVFGTGSVGTGVRAC